MRTRGAKSVSCISQSSLRAGSLVVLSAGSWLRFRRPSPRYPTQATSEPARRLVPKTRPRFQELNGILTATSCHEKGQ